MIELSAAWVLYGFYGLAGVLVLIALLQVLNSLRHGSRMPVNIVITAVYVVAIVALGIVTNSMLSTVDWNGSFQVSLPDADFLRFGL